MKAQLHLPALDLSWAFLKVQQLHFPPRNLAWTRKWLSNSLWRAQLHLPALYLAWTLRVEDQRQRFYLREVRRSIALTDGSLMSHWHRDIHLGGMWRLRSLLSSSPSVGWDGSSSFDSRGHFLGVRGAAFILTFSSFPRTQFHRLIEIKTVNETRFGGLHIFCSLRVFWFVVMCVD